MTRFGPSGNSESFYNAGYKSSLDAPEWLRKIGLTAYEYQCNKGVKIGKESAQKLGEKAKENDIFLSIHAPYYISMASAEYEKRINSKKYILDSMQAAKWIGAKRVVVHTGSCGSFTRQEAVALAIEVLRDTIKEADDAGFSDITICPEVLGKINQLGDLDEIIYMCKIDERLIPTIDFGHIHAREMGSLNSVDDFLTILNKVENELGFDRLKNIHCHFSRIEYTKGGEKKHWTLSDTQFGPDFEFLAKAIVIKKIEPVIICESRNKMAEDALEMKKILEEIEKISK